jgi:hypothetical protein
MAADSFVSIPGQEAMQNTQQATASNTQFRKKFKSFRAFKETTYRRLQQPTKKGKAQDKKRKKHQQNKKNEKRERERRDLEKEEETKSQGARLNIKKNFRSKIFSLLIFSFFRT